VAFSPDGKPLASASPTAVKLWDLTTGKARASWAGNSEAGMHMGLVVWFSADGRTLFSASGQEVRHWDLPVVTGPPR
jgi:WD40 repeat protein